MIDDLAKERIELEMMIDVNPLEYALKWEALSQKFEAEGRSAAATICIFRARHFAGLHASSQNAKMN